MTDQTRNPIDPTWDYQKCHCSNCGTVTEHAIRSEATDALAWQTRICGECDWEFFVMTPDTDVKPTVLRFQQWLPTRRFES